MVLLLAAVDVTLLQVKVPKLSAAKLRAALPNLVEDQLMTDPSECVVVAGGVADGLRIVAVAKRAWIESLDKTLTALGARHVVALPAQLCLPYQADERGHFTGASCSVVKIGDTADIALRLSEHSGIGLAISTDQASAPHDAIQAMDAILPDAPFAIYVPQSEVSLFQEASSNIGESGKRFSVSMDSWSRWVSGAKGTTLDLMAGLDSRAGTRLQLREWRWPLALAASVLLLNVFALNIDWWRMKSEASSLRATMIKTYKSAFPKETVIIDPVAQMQQKIAAIKGAGGIPDDFIAITSAFGGAWARATASSKAPAIGALEYRERSLLVRMKPLQDPAGTPGADARDIDALTQRLKAALAERNLSLEQVPGAEIAWKVRSTK